MGVGEPPSWEKAAMYVVMCSVLITSGGGPISVDLLWGCSTFATVSDLTVESLTQVIADANGISDSGERWIHRCAAGKEAGINNV